jgi:hypothetical protein
MDYSLSLTATRSQSGPADVGHKPGGHTSGGLLSSIHSRSLPTLTQHEKTVAELVARICSNTRRYVDLFSDVVDKLMPTPTKDISEHDEVIDVILHQRRERNEQTEGAQDGFPSHLLRR